MVSNFASSVDLVNRLCYTDRKIYLSGGRAMNAAYNSKSLVLKVCLLIAISIFILACAGGGLAVATPTPQSTETPLPSPTNTPKPTATKRPTSTPLPTATLVPTPAPVGETVKYGSLEITVLDVVTHDLIVPGGQYYWYTPEGYIFIDVGVLVKNLNPGSPVSVEWGYIGVQEASGDAWYPGFADTKAVSSGTQVDPFSIGIATEVKPDDVVVFEEDTYMRLIFVVVEDFEQDILFGIESSPLITFKLKK